MDSKKSINIFAQYNLKDCKEAFEILSKENICILIKQLQPGWTTNDLMNSIEKTFVFSSYSEGLKLTIWLANLAEETNHHPDLLLGYKMLTVKISTHNINALSLADFILAANLEKHLQNVDYGILKEKLNYVS